MPELEKLDCLIESPTAVNGHLSTTSACCHFFAPRQLSKVCAFRERCATILKP